MPVKSLTPRQRITVVNASMAAVANMHGSVTDKDHSAECRTCRCEYGQALRGLHFMRRELYASIQKAKKLEVAK